VCEVREEFTPAECDPLAQSSPYPPPDKATGDRSNSGIEIRDSLRHMGKNKEHVELIGASMSIYVCTVFLKKRGARYGQLIENPLFLQQFIDYAIAASLCCFFLLRLT
jgi:hypothetical protein